jgi:tetratricopeptide (TPR) repeat protein
VASDLDFADYHLKRKDFANAQVYTNHAANLSRYCDQFQLAKINHSYAKIYLGEKQYAKALDYLRKAEPIMREDSPKDYSELQKSMSEAYAAIGNGSSPTSISTPTRICRTTCSQKRPRTTSPKWRHNSRIRENKPRLICFRQKIQSRILRSRMPESNGIFLDHRTGFDFGGRLAGGHLLQQAKKQPCP